MFGWFKAEAVRASFSKRARRSASSGESRRQHLDRDLARELRVPRPVDLAHAAGAEGRDESRRSPDARPGERHRDSRSFIVERVEPVRLRTRSVSVAGPILTMSRSRSGAARGSSSRRRRSRSCCRDPRSARRLRRSRIRAWRRDTRLVVDPDDRLLIPADQVLARVERDLAPAPDQAIDEVRTPGCRASSTSGLAAAKKA